MGDGEPAGQRVFLFTDIEGSTRLWERFAEGMPAALAHHDMLLQVAIGAHRGRIFKTAGDAMCAVFADATSAALAAVAAQRALAATVWNEIGLIDPLTVRMAIHTGPAQEIAGDFSGAVLNRLSRLLAAGHGGQIIIAGAVADLLAASLPDGVELRDLGERRLRDIPGAERIVQLSIDGLPSTFPPLKTLESIAHNLPAAPTPCIGREAERARLRTLLPRSDVRLVTLVGPGGIGKTRLALQAATDLLDEFPDGVWFVDLTPVRETGLVAGTVIRALGIREEAGKSTEEALLQWLRQRELLLVLDNCEQVIEGAAQLAAAVLRNAPKVRVLATSRSPLGLRGEQRVPVEPLALPGDEKQPDYQRIQQTASVQLFVARASAVRPSFALSNVNAPHVAEICRRVDGIPLALELAAARITVLSPEALRDRLNHRLPTLTAGARDLPDRHQTLRNAIRWSYELLSPGEQKVFRGLAVFAGGWSLSAAEAVLGDDLDADLLDTLESLAAQSLIRAEPDSGEVMRFSMLETLREFAQELLAETGEELQIRELHAEYFLQMTEDSESSLFGKNQLVSLAELDREYGNVRAALSLFSRLKRADPILRISVVIWNYWETRGFGEEGQQWVRNALEMEAFSDPNVLVNALNRVGNLTIDLGDIDGAGAYFERSLRLAMRHRDLQMIARNLCSLGLIANLQGRYEDESRLLSRSLTLSQRLGDARGVALATLNLAISAREAGDAQRSLPLFEEAYRLREAMEDEDGLAWTAFYFGLLHRDLDSTDQAACSFSQSLDAFRSLGNIVGVAYAQYGLGLIALDRKQFELAETNFLEAVESHHLRHDRPAAAECLEALALLSTAKLEFERAASLLGTAAAIREQAGVPVRNSDHARHEALFAEVRTTLGSLVFEALFEAGKHADLRESTSLENMFS